VECRRGGQYERDISTAGREVKTGFLPKEINANRFFWDFHWLESGKTTNVNGTEWRERDYGLRKIRDAAEK
jgi:hypothetical protein